MVWRWVFGGALMMAVGALWWHAEAQREALSAPLSLTESEYVGSARCRACHSDHYASWHRTYHRRMTAEANPETVLGDFSGAAGVDYFGVRATMERAADGGFQMRVEGDGEPFVAPIVRTVGSHRYQQYLTRQDDLYLRLPVAWDVEAQRFIHMNGAFLTPDPEQAENQAVQPGDFNRHVTRWNDNCIFCHNVAPNPGADGAGHFDSRVAELGVACEACHGPGARHVEANRDPVRRYLQHLNVATASDIAGPSHLSAARSSEVCGRCHGQRITRDIDAVHREGDRFVPGEALSNYSRPLFRGSTLGGEEGVFATRFYTDGTPRLTAYEYQGYLQSACRADDAFDCSSCHSMHAADPAGQVRAAPEGEASFGDDHLCLQCHAELSSLAARAAHSRHDVQGPGGRCVACHMPKVVYGLVRSHRSHRITSPGPAAASAAPDACGLCHVNLDGKDLAAARAELDWHDGPAAMPEQSSVADLAFAGDPVERAIAVAALGEDGAHAAGLVGSSALALCLAVFAEDRYPAVREIARRCALHVLGEQDGGRAAVDILSEMQSTARRSHRLRVIAELRELLPVGALVTLDEDHLDALRAQATTVAISIGE